MNEKEVAELRRRFRQDRSGISHVRGCYVNENREIVSQFDQPLGVMTQEENEKILGLLKRTLSGTLGKNLLDITFATQQVVHGEEHKLLMALRSSELGDEEAIQAFFQKVIWSMTPMTCPTDTRTGTSRMTHPQRCSPISCAVCVR